MSEVGDKHLMHYEVSSGWVDFEYDSISYTHDLEDAQRIWQLQQKDGRKHSEIWKVTRERIA